MKKIEIPLYDLANSFDKLSGGHCLYYWMLDGQYLYIGQTTDIKSRTRSHINNFERFIYEADMLIVEYPKGYTYYDRDIINLESQAIKKNKPKYNIIGTLNALAENERRFTGSQRSDVRSFYLKLSSLIARSNKPVFNSDGQKVDFAVNPKCKEQGTTTISDGHFRQEVESTIYRLTKNWGINEWSSFRKHTPHNMTYTNDPNTNKWDFHRRSILSAINSYISEIEG